MPQIAADPKAAKNIRVKVGASNYELHVQSVKFGKTPPRPVSWQGGTPAAIYTDSSASVDHVCNIRLVHDYDTADSAYNFFRANEGVEAVLEYMPDGDGTYVETATITIVAPDPGGDYGVFHESTVACPSTPPVRTFLDAAAPTITAITPSTVGTAGGDSIVIKGTGYADASSVTIDGDEVEFTVLSAELILVESVPANAADDYDVVVTNGTGSSAAETLTYA